MGTHAPGPWHWQKGERFARLYAKEGRHAIRVLVADQQSGSRIVPINPADARLIAAAPELLKACKKTLPHVEFLLGGKGQAVDALRAAIACAESGPRMMQVCVQCGNEVELPADLAPLVNALGQPMCRGCFALWRQTHPAPEPRAVPVRSSKYQFTPDIGEISGFGGGYEQTCRNMLAAGLEWLDANPSADPRFQGFKGIYGIITEENEDAKALSRAVVDAADNDCTGAMHQAVISHCLAVRKIGWDAYCVKMREREQPL